MIAGPILEALRYTYDEENLREMYENLLASAMDNRIVSQAHPSFVDAIKQMSVVDAQVIKRISEIDENLRCAEFKFKLKETTKVYVNAMPDYFVEELCDIADPFIISASLINLQRLGVITITQMGLMGADYDVMKKNTYLLSREALYREQGKYDFEISLVQHAVTLNNYGKQFISTCLPKKVTI
jgi:hypothetical protein